MVATSRRPNLNTSQRESNDRSNNKEQPNKASSSGGSSFSDGFPRMIRTLLKGAVFVALLLNIVFRFPALEPVRSEKKGVGIDTHVPPPPIWSATALARKRLENTEDPTASTVKWRTVGRSGAREPALRHITELVTFGLGSLIPYYGNIMPAIRIVSRHFDQRHPRSKIELTQIPGLVDATLDLHECKVGRKTRNGTRVKDGRYSVCFPKGENTGREAARELCFLADKPRISANRIHDYPAPGHELWSCSDLNVMEQMVAAHVLDYLVGHRDRFYERRTNNLFFFKDQRPIQFASIDHDCTTPFRLLNNKGYKKFFEMKMLRDYHIPRDLETDIRRLRLLGSKEDFVQNFNFSVYGELDLIKSFLVPLWSDPQFDDTEDPPRPTKNYALRYTVTDILWNRLESVVKFYNISVDH